MSINYDVTSENNSDGSDGYDGARDSASNINNNDAISITPNQSEIKSNIIEEGQGATSRAVTAVTAVTSTMSGNDTMDMQISRPPTDLQQTTLEIIQNAGEIYWSNTNWHCRHCKLHGDRFYGSPYL
jgi:hypothetical protein